MLLKPWHDLQHDLKTPNESWSQVFELSELLSILSGIRYLHKCQTAMANDNANEDIQNHARVAARRCEDLNDDIMK